ncbi:MULTISPECIES: VWA domain-containing protein [unclassified Nocardioides]|uniref:VWA domain-containing protein n=1 Tax=unclassified Nocardioides TaxID=2615069 RepID=UPI0000571237|nr:MULTISPECIES: VWA domain-containing protein [unclassified Nocardioides]ABL82391.1 protoporphyrin IX magnesium-chelatase [Nocardioides sp. JS614]
MPLHYPFSAVLGCDVRADLDDMGLALVLTTISPEIGGVLVRGEKGTAKSTAVRALGALLPPLVELPIGATEDRVVGSIQLESALSEGKVEVEKGLLARANGGLLYVDEVNLLHDHLVDLLLDAAAMGRVSVERDGISVEHDARFVLIGTMNPEEGELRPQLLDRFGLTVEVAAPRAPEPRAEVVRRRMAYDADPVSFIETYAAAEKDLDQRIHGARASLADVVLSDAALLKIAEVCAAFEVDGLRADIVTARAAVAHAAWEGRDAVTRADIRRAATLALPHRRRRNPFDAPGLDEDLLDRILGDDELPPEPPPGTDHEEGPEAAPGTPGTPRTDGAAPSPGADAEGGSDSDGGGTDPSGPDPALGPPEPQHRPEAADTDDRASTVAAGSPYRPKLLTVRGVGAGASGRRSRARTSTGRRVGASRPADGRGSLHLLETIRAAAPRQGSRGRTGGRLALRRDDLRVATREGRESNLILFCVDSSGSMAARKRMIQVKTAILSLLLDAYRRRDKVGLVTFRGDSADLVLPPTHSVDVAAARLDELPAGGRTPLAEGLWEAAKVLRRERLRDPRLRPLLVVVTDGRATAGRDAVRRSLQAAEHVAGLAIASVVIDGEAGPLRLGLAIGLARSLNAEHVPVAEVSAEALTRTVTRKVA